MEGVTTKMDKVRSEPICKITFETMAKMRKEIGEGHMEIGN